MRCLPDVADALVEIGDMQTRKILACFSAYLKNTALIDLQEKYTAAFDMDPATSLNLTYHLLGDDGERGRVLSNLQQVYDRAGYGAAAPELPDYLPMVLEFLAIQPDAAHAERLWSCLGAVRTIAQRLSASGSPYAPLLDHLAKMTPQPADNRQPGDPSKDNANP